MKKNKIVVSLFMTIVLLLISVTGIYADSVETAEYHEYDSYVKEFMSQYTYISKTTGEERVWEYGTELAYEHYADDADVPEYIVLFLLCNGNGDTIYYEANGYYFYGHQDYQYQSRPSYLVFDTETKEVCWFDEALEKDFDKYFSFISESGYNKITRIGDVNRDNELNIKDATEIQKFLAGLSVSFDEYDDMVVGFEEKMNGQWERYVSDFNRDGVRSIKDATAIQKHVAGLE